MTCRRALMKMIRKTLLWIPSRWNCSRISATSWRSMRIRIFLIHRKHADPQGVPDTPDEWLDQFGTFSIYQVLPEIIELWGLNVQTQVESKKNFERLTGK